MKITSEIWEAAAREYDMLRNNRSSAVALVAAKLTEIEILKEALKECADDLAAYIEHYYEGTLNYPSQKARYDRDMAPVVRARELLGPALDDDTDLPTHHDVRGILK